MASAGGRGGGRGSGGGGGGGGGGGRASADERDPLPLSAAYDSRKNCSAALKHADDVWGGKGVRLDSSRSRGDYAVFRCPSVILSVSENGKNKGKTVWAGEGLDGFVEPQRRATETATAFHRRRIHDLEAYAQGRICCFKAIASRIEDGRWVFQRIGDDGSNVIHHAEDCTSVGKITAAAAAAALRADVLANPGLSAKESAAQLLTAHSRPVGVGQLPSDRTLRRAVQQVREEADEWHDENWARLFDYLMELDPEEFFVDVVVDAGCHFKSYFVGIVAALKILKEGGLDYYSVDACHIKHVMSNGLQLHLLVGRTGANKFQTIAFSLDLGETADSYQRFADNCREFGFGVLADVEPGPFERVAVAFSDGFKGTTYFTQLFQRVFHARCA